MVPWALDDRQGVDQVVLNLSRTLREDGAFTPRVLIDHWDYRELTIAPGSNGEEVLYRLRSPVYGNRPLRSFAGFVWELFSALRTLAKFLRSNRVAVVNSHYPRTGHLLFSLVRALRLADFRFILSVHGADIRSANKSSRIERLLWTLLLSSADAVIACSESLAVDVRQMFPKAKGHVIAVHNGIDISTFLSKRDATFCLPQDLFEKPYLLTVAAYERKKGLDVLVDATARVIQRFPNLHLVLVGNEGSDRTRIQAMVEARALSDRVHIFVDIPHARILTFMERARLFVLPSRIESFGLVLMEAAACAIPVIATQVGGIPEIIQDGLTGRLVPPEDPEKLASAICDLLNAPEEAQRFAAALRRRVASQFSWDRARNRYLRVVRGRVPDVVPNEGANVRVDDNQHRFSP